jgi:outer membrane protein TolC
VQGHRSAKSIDRVVYQRGGTGAATRQRQRFDAGVTDNVEVVQAQESVAGAELDYINSVFAHNLAKLSLARAIGGAAESLGQFLKLQ